MRRLVANGVIAVVLGALLLPLPGVADEHMLSIGLSKQDTGTAIEQIDRLASALHSNGWVKDRTDSLLARIGFTVSQMPDVDAKTWDGFSSVQKISYAVVAAEAKVPGSGARLIDALLLRSRDANSPNVVFEFAPVAERNRSLEAVFSSIPAVQREAIVQISGFATRGAVGSVVSLVTEFFELPKNNVYRILFEAGGNTKLVFVGILRANPPNVFLGFQKLTERIATFYPNFYEAKPELRGFWNRMHRQSPRPKKDCCRLLP